jgi:hypothetical protein
MKIRHRNESGNKEERNKEREASADARSSRGRLRGGFSREVY